MATPVVSGVVADLLQGHPALTPDQVKARLMKTAYKTFPTSSTAVDPVTGESFVSQYDIFTIGAGYLDVAAAMANTDVATGTAMSPTAVYDPNLAQVSLQFDPSSIWNEPDLYVGRPVSGAPSVWSLTTVWGAVVVDANKTVWGTQTVWASSTLTGFKTVWGTSGIWADKTVWGTSGPSADKTVWGTDASTSDSDTNFKAQP
jgi:serine protease AprX